jgi:uncharacterized protein YdaU (DUF1376 family)
MFENKIYYFQEKSNEVLDLQDIFSLEEIGIYFILKAAYFKYAGNLQEENLLQKCKFFGDKAKLFSVRDKIFKIKDGMLENKNWNEEIKEIKEKSNKRKNAALVRWKKDNLEDKKLSTNSKELKKTQSVFTKPTIEEIKNYCLERKNNVDANNFFDFYESKGWKVGNSTMKNWQACVRTWEQRSNQTKFTNQSQNSYNKPDDLDYYARMIAHNSNGGKNGV